jgi:cellulose 1,4-beta-cellobiosidase
MKGLVAFSVYSVANGQAPGTLTKENHPKLDYEVCGATGCTKHTTGMVIDSNWRWTHIAGSTTNCFTGNLWDAKLCPDEATCSKQCVIEGADKEYTGTYGVTTKADKISLQFVTEGPYTTNVGSRLYMMDNDDTNYKMFHMKNREFTFTVDDADIDCGLNGALYFVQMDKDGGKSKYSKYNDMAGAKYGTGYCDAQCPHDMKWIHGRANVEDWVPSETDVNAGKGKYGTCCTEIDLWEANKISMAFTMHACDADKQGFRCEGTDCGDFSNTDHQSRFKGVCDKNGCDIQHTRFMGKGQTFYGPGSKYKIDTTKPVTVTTQFITADGTDTGKLTEVKQLYTQNGRTIEHPKYSLNANQHNSITDKMCADWVHETKDGTNFLAKGGLKAVDDAFTAGAVLVVSLWDDHDVNMLWLDSNYPIDADATQKGAYRGSCKVTSGAPSDVEKNIPNATIHFSGIKWGPIGKTIQKSNEVSV